jgi:hypothetical protein
VLQTLELGKEADVYSFGMVLYEVLVCGLCVCVCVCV